MLNSDHHIWRLWASFIQHWGAEEWVASFLEAAGPLSILGAQAVYISQPYLSQALPEGHLDALARLLEDQTATKAFATLLREEPEP